MAGPFWTAVAERSGDTAFAPGGAEADGPGSRFARCQSGGAVRRLPDSATAVQNPPGPDPGSGHEPRPRTAPDVSGQGVRKIGFAQAVRPSASMTSRRTYFSRPRSLWCASVNNDPFGAVNLSP